METFGGACIDDDIIATQIIIDQRVAARQSFYGMRLGALGMASLSAIRAASPCRPFPFIVIPALDNGRMLDVP